MCLLHACKATKRLCAAILCPCCRTTAIYQKVLRNEVNIRNNITPFLFCTFWCTGYAVATVVDQIKPNSGIIISRVMPHFAHGCIGCIGCIGCLYMFLIVLLGTVAVQHRVWYALLRPQQ